MDLPGSGYASLIDHTEVGPWTPSPTVGFPPLAVGGGPIPISLLPFLEKFILRFVATLSTRLGQPGLVESRIAAVVGGSLGGNLALRLATTRAVAKECGRLVARIGVAGIQSEILRT